MREVTEPGPMLKRRIFGEKAQAKQTKEREDDMSGTEGGGMVVWTSGSKSSPCLVGREAVTRKTAAKGQTRAQIVTEVNAETAMTTSGLIMTIKICQSSAEQETELCWFKTGQPWLKHRL